MSPLALVAPVVKPLVPAGGPVFGGCGSFEEVRPPRQEEVTRNRSLKKPPSSTAGFTLIGANSATQDAVSKVAPPGLCPHDRSKP